MLEFKKISDDTLEVMKKSIGTKEDYHTLASDKIQDLLYLAE